MAHWLIKSEPSKWSWEDQLRAGEAGTAWTGVRNHLAKRNLMAMALGDLAFFYHSNEGRVIVGIVDVIAEAYGDPTAEAGAPWVAVDVRARETLPNPVSLARARANPELAGMALIASSRLSVQPVAAREWAEILRMAVAPG